MFRTIRLERLISASEGVRDLEALKVKKLAPSVRAAMKTKQVRKAVEEYKYKESTSTAPKRQPPEPAEARGSQAQGDRSGIKVWRDHMCC